MYDDKGGRVWQGELDSFGAIKDFKGNSITDCPFRYQGQYEDSETGLYYNRFRYYSPEEGMYISQDPIRLNGGDRLYGYVGDVNGLVDVFGLSKKVPRYNGPKPTYHVNEKHVKIRKGSNATPLAKDAEAVYKRSVPDDAVNPRNWYGKNADGEVYRYSSSNDGTAHFSGRENHGDGIRNKSSYANERLKSCK